MPSTLWDDIKKTVKEGVSVAAEKTEEYTKIGKVKVDILNIKRNIDKLYEDLGKQVYDLLSQGKKGDLASNKRIGELFTKLKEQTAALKKKESEIEDIKQDVATKAKSRHEAQKTETPAKTKSEKDPKPAAKPKTTTTKKQKTGSKTGTKGSG